MTSGGDWLTWPEAAALVGCPVPTIDWYTRAGRIEKRPKVGNRPSLKRSSVEEFAQWWRARQTQREARRQQRAVVLQQRARHRARAEELGIRPARMPPVAPASGRWLTSAEAAAILGVSRPTVLRLARDGCGSAVQVGTRWWFDEGAVKALAQERSLWLSFKQAAGVVGCSEQTIRKAVKAGRLRQRRVDRVLPSLDRASVEEFAHEFAARKQQRVAARERRRRPRSRPPEDGNVWLDATTTALVLGLSPSRVYQLAQEDRLPHVLAGRRRWFRRDLIEQRAAALALTRRP